MTTTWQFIASARTTTTNAAGAKHPRPTNAQQKRENSGALAALRQRMGSLYPVLMFAAGALPVAAAHLISVLNGTPTIADTLLLIVLIGLAMIANFTLYGNAMKLLGERLRPGPGSTS